MSKKTRPNPGSRESLCEFADTMAAICREEITSGGAPIPKVYVVARSGEVDLYASPFRNIAEKRAFQRLVKNRAQGMSAGALIAVTDSWRVRRKAATPGEAVRIRAEMPQSLEECSDRQEAVMVSVCTRQFVLWRVWPYERTPEGIVWAEPELDLEGAADEWDPWSWLRGPRSSN